MPASNTLIGSGGRRSWRFTDVMDLPHPRDDDKISDDQSAWLSEGKIAFRRWSNDTMLANAERMAPLFVSVPAGVTLRPGAQLGLGLQNPELIAGRYYPRNNPIAKLFPSGPESDNDPADTWADSIALSVKPLGDLHDASSVAASQKAIAILAFKRGYVDALTRRLNPAEPMPGVEPSRSVARWKAALNSLVSSRRIAVEVIQTPNQVDLRPVAIRLDAQVDERRALFNDLYRSFETEPFENGIGHAADQIIENTLADARTLDWFTAFCVDESEPGFAASVLRCLGRQPEAGHPSWRNELIRTALQSSDVEIRDAAVQAAESWGGQDIVDVLMSHDEPETWIRDYIQDVIEDLGA